MNFNKLVQPECGGSNPLVSAAQQLAMRTSTSKATAVAAKLQTHHQQPAASGPSFSNEFIQLAKQMTQKPPSQPAGLIAAQLNQISISEQQLHSQPTSVHLHQQQQQQHQVHDPAQMIQRILDVAYQSNPVYHQQQQQMQQKPSTSSATQNGKLAADYLAEHDQAAKQPAVNESELKTDPKASKPKTQDRDDFEFWQGLAQKYDGIATTTSSDYKSDILTSLGENLEDHPLNQDALQYTFDERNPLKDKFKDPFAEGIKRLEEGDIPSAALLFEDAVQKDSERAEAWHYLGTTQAQNEKDKSAIQALKNCIKLNPADQDARIALAVSLANESKFKDACYFLLEWLMNNEKYKSLNISMETYNNGLGLRFDEKDCYYSLKKCDQYQYIHDKFVQAARMSPNNPDPQVQTSLGVLSNMAGDYQRAGDCFKAALSVKPNDSLLWNRLGATLANNNKSEDAIVAYKKALEISPGFLRSRYNLAISLTHLNLYNEACRQLVQILNMQAAGKKDENSRIRTRSVTSVAIWNTLRTVATLNNRPDLYPIIDSRDLEMCNKKLLEEATGN